MKQIQNPLKIKNVLEAFPMSSIFTQNYSSAFLFLEYEKDEFLIRDGETNDYLFFLRFGTVKCFSYSPSGKIQFFSYLSNTDAIGLVGSIWGEPAISNIQALDKCQCIALPLSRYREELLNDNKFLRYLCKQLGNNLYNSNCYLQVVQCTSIESKIAAVILGTASDGVCQINLSSTAEVVGTTYRHVLRILNKFCGNHILEKKGRNYLIKDEESLSICAKDAYEYIANELYHTSINATSSQALNSSASL